MDARREGKRLTMGFRAEGWRARVRDPDLNGAQSLRAESLAMRSHLDSGLLRV